MIVESKDQYDSTLILLDILTDLGIKNARDAAYIFCGDYDYEYKECSWCNEVGSECHCDNDGPDYDHDYDLTDLVIPPGTGETPKN